MKPVRFATAMFVVLASMALAATFAPQKEERALTMLFRYGRPGLFRAELFI